MAPEINTIYYVFSTIAQTLAAFVGILAAFAVVRLSDLAAHLRNELPAFAYACQYPETFYAALAAGDYTAALGCIEDAAANDAASMRLSACIEVDHDRQQLLGALRRSLLTAGVVILLSVAALILAKPLSSGSTATWLALGIGFCGLVASLTVAGSLLPSLRRNVKRKARRTSKRLLSRQKMASKGT